MAYHQVLREGREKGTRLVEILVQEVAWRKVQEKPMAFHQVLREGTPALEALPWDRVAFLGPLVLDIQEEMVEVHH